MKGWRYRLLQVHSNSPRICNNGVLMLFCDLFSIHEQLVRWMTEDVRGLYRLDGYVTKQPGAFTVENSWLYCTLLTYSERDIPSSSPLVHLQRLRLYKYTIAM